VTAHPYTSVWSHLAQVPFSQGYRLIAGFALTTVTLD
jgi:hypothetical protein